MALQAFSLKRSQDATGPSLIEIVPKNWHKFPLPETRAMVTPVWVRAQSALGGVVGDDVDTATATLITDQIPANGPNTALDFAPRNEAQKATMMGTTLAVDVARPRGTIGPRDPYPTSASTPLAAPVITSLSPATAVSVSGPDVVVTITGTGFTQWSTVTSGGYPIPVRYVSPTKLSIVQKPSASVAGTVQVVVVDHNVKSAPSNFVFT